MSCIEGHNGLMGLETWAMKLGPKIRKCALTVGESLVFVLD